LSAFLILVFLFFTRLVGAHALATLAFLLLLTGLSLAWLVTARWLPRLLLSGTLLRVIAGLVYVWIVTHDVSSSGFGKS
jgi:predicted permease